MSEYAHALRNLKLKDSHLPSEIGDQWRTPDWLFLALNKLYGPFVIDLFTDGQNSKCPWYFTADDNALLQDWKARIDLINAGLPVHEQGYAFANPPYSIKRAGRGKKAIHVTGMTHIMAKAHEEHLKGVPSFWLVKSATSESWWPDSIASQIIHIKGRIGYEAPVWYKPDLLAGDIGGAGFGASLVIFNGMNSIQVKEEYIRREDLMEIGLPLAGLQADEREKWIKIWDEI